MHAPALPPTHPPPIPRTLAGSLCLDQAAEHLHAVARGARLRQQHAGQPVLHQAGGGHVGVVLESLVAVENGLCGGQQGRAAVGGVRPAGGAGPPRPPARPRAPRPAPPRPAPPASPVSLTATPAALMPVSSLLAFLPVDRS